MHRYHPRHIHHHFLRNLHIPSALIAAIAVGCFLSVSTFVLASTAVNFQMVINPGVLAVNMVDENFNPVATPTVNMGSKFQSNVCQIATSILGTATQKIYVKNPGVANNGWVVTLSAASSGDTWQGDAARFDFNDSSSSWCTDWSDTDIYAGQMTVNPVVGNLSLWLCSLSCVGGGVILWSAASFQEWSIDTITLLSAAAESSDSADWILQGINIAQTIPQNQSVSENYTLDLYLSVTAN